MRIPITFLLLALLSVSVAGGQESSGNTPEVSIRLAPDQVRRFDEEHARLLERVAPEEFTILHRIDAHILEPIEAS